MQQDISVALFLGFLESGKTKFIQELLEDKRNDVGGRTMLLVCEQGVEEYEPEKFAVKDVVIVTLEGAEELTRENLEKLTEKHNPQKVIIEYNGMWNAQNILDAMPDNWGRASFQVMTFFDAATFFNYNSNMRQFTADKIQNTQMVVFNRFKGEYDKMEYHKVVRGLTRMPQIIYDYLGGNPVLDDIEDPLPFDKTAPVIEIDDRDYAWFNSDVDENTKDYIGKRVKFKGMAYIPDNFPKGFIALGREIMTCCEADTAYSGFVVKTNELLKNITSGDWLIVTAKLIFKYNAGYGSKGPVLVAEKLERAEPPEERVATFY